VGYDEDRGHIAMPKLVGGPKYSRPPVTGVQPVERPPDPDDFPLLSEWTPEDHVLAQELGLDGRAEAATRAAPVPAQDAGHAARSGALWSIPGGAMAAESRPQHRGFGLFRSRNGRSGIG
jgi:hypothetical protein